MIPFKSHDKYVKILCPKLGWMLRTRDCIHQCTQESHQQEGVTCRVRFMRIMWQVEESFVPFSFYASFFKSQCSFSAASFCHADFRHWSPAILQYEILNSSYRFEKELWPRMFMFDSVGLFQIERERRGAWIWKWMMATLQYFQPLWACFDLKPG